MKKEWLLPSIYESNIKKDYDIAVSLINNYAEGKIEYPPQLINHIEKFFCVPQDAEIALKDFVSQLSDADDVSDILDNVECLAVISVAIVSVWSSTKNEGGLQALLALIRHSWWLECLWADSTIVIARRDESFRSTIVAFAAQHFIDVEEKLIKEHTGDSVEPFPLGDIWSGFPYESRVNETSWPWVKLLAELDFEQFLKSMASIRSPQLLNRVLDSPTFYNNYDLWEQSILRAAPCFENDGTWNGEILLPSLIRHGKSMLFHVADRQEYPKDILEAHVKHLLTSLRDSLAKRADFSGIFKRWGTWLTRQNLNLPAHESQRKTLITSHDLLIALADKIAPSFSLDVSSNLDNSWDPWAYHSMLALLHSERPSQFSPPDITSFISEWNLNQNEWDSGKGQQLREHAKYYHSTKLNSYACRVLGYSLALTGDFANHWLSMWNGSISLREILEFFPTKTTEHWKSSDASSLMRTLVDIGLGVLDCTVYEQDPLDAESLSKSAELFAFLWSATTEMLSIDLYGDEFWAKMQQQLAIRRIGWTNESNQSAERGYLAHMDKEAEPKAVTLLKSMATNTSSLIKLLPLVIQNTTKENLSKLLAETELNITALASSARKYQQAPEIKFNIHPYHISLIDELKQSIEHSK